MKTNLTFLAALTFVVIFLYRDAGIRAGSGRLSTRDRAREIGSTRHHQTFDGSNWNTASTPPPGTSGTITIQTGHTVTVTAGNPDTIKGAAIVINGYLKDSAYINFVAGSMTVNNGATYEMAHPSNSGQGVPTATWNTGSTCLVSGITSSATGINVTQNFYNFIWNCPGQSANVNIGWQGGTVIKGTLTVTNSNWNHASTSSPANQLRLFGAAGSCT